MKKLLIPIFALFLASLACGGIGLAYEYDLVADYAVWAPDLVEQAAVVQKGSPSSGTVVIPSMVFAFGWNDDFIIAQRHPNEGNIRNVDESITQWYLLVVATGTIHGPLIEAEYEQLRQELGVPDELDFSQTITP